MKTKINFAVWRSRLTLAAGYVFAAAAALQTGVAGLPPLLPMIPEHSRHTVAVGIAILMTLQAVQTRVQHPTTVQESAEGPKDAETNDHAQEEPAAGDGGTGA